MKDCLKDLSKTTWNMSLNTREDDKEWRLDPSETVAAQPASLGEAHLAWEMFQS